MLARKITLAQDLERVGGDLGLTVRRCDGRRRRLRTATAEETPLRTAAAAGVVALHHESTRAGGISVRARGRGKWKRARGLQERLNE